MTRKRGTIEVMKLLNSLNKQTRITVAAFVTNMPYNQYGAITKQVTCVNSNRSQSSISYDISKSLLNMPCSPINNIYKLIRVKSKTGWWAQSQKPSVVLIIMICNYMWHRLQLLGHALPEREPAILSQIRIAFARYVTWLECLQIGCSVGESTINQPGYVTHEGASCCVQQMTNPCAALCILIVTRPN